MQNDLKVFKSQSNIVLITVDAIIYKYIHNPNLKIPNLRWIMENGASAEKVKSVYPTVTWPNHVSIVTGTYPRKHGVIGNWVIDRANQRVGEYYGDQVWTKEEAIHGQTLYDVAKEKGLVTASVCWPGTRDASTIDFNIPFCTDQSMLEAHSTTSLWKELLDSGLPVDSFGTWMKDKSRNHMLDWLSTETAKHIIRHHQPNLFMMRYASTDSYQHEYGPYTNEAFWALEYVDSKIGEIMDVLKEVGIWENTDLFVMSDHGFFETTKTIYPNILFKNKGWIQENNIGDSQVIATSNGGSGFVYILEDEALQREQLKNEVREALLQTEGIIDVIESEDFEKYGLPKEGELQNIRPDFIFETEPNYFIHYDGFDVKGEKVVTKGAKFRGMHGHFPNHDELKGFFMATGCSIKTGLEIPEINNIDVAPSIAQLFNGQIQDADGRVLNELWERVKNSSQVIL